MFELKPLYEMNARFGFVGSIAMPVTKRCGSMADKVSRRLNVTVVAGSASALREIKTRPVCVAAHNVVASAVARSTATI